MSKRKADKELLSHELNGIPGNKKSKMSSMDTKLDSPKRRAFSRICKFERGDKVIGFYGGWPYVGVVLTTSNVRMSFGSTYLVQIRWNGFSGKNATSWLSEFDVMKHNDASLKMKNEMEEAQRELQKAAGKIDKVKQKRIFLQVISQYRGKRLAPFAPLTASYPDEWQVLIRVAALPKVLVDHLKGCEGLINERKLLIVHDDGVVTAHDVLSDWAGNVHERQAYRKTISELFGKFFMQLLVYRLEVPAVVKKIVECCHSPPDYIRTFSAEFLLRLTNVLPQILTPAGLNVFKKSADSELLSTLVEFMNAHQSFLGFLEDNIERLLRAPIRKATLDEPLPDDFWVDELIPCDAIRQLDVQNQDIVDVPADKLTVRKKSWKNKRKHPQPVYKGPIRSKEEFVEDVSIETPSIY